MDFKRLDQFIDTLAPLGIPGGDIKVMYKGQEVYRRAFTVDNLFDKRYCDYGEYFDPWYVYPAAGRSFIFTVRYEF